MHFPSFIMLISSACQKDKLFLCSQAFFGLNPVPNVYSTTPVEFRIIIAYQESIIASFEDIWQSKFSQNVDRR